MIEILDSISTAPEPIRLAIGICLGVLAGMVVFDPWR